MTTVHVVQRNMKPEPCQRGEHRLAQPTVESRHRSTLDRAPARRRPAPLYQVEPVSKRHEEARDITAVVAPVRVTPDHVAAARGGHPAHECRAIATLRDGYDARTGAFGDIARAIGAAIVRDHHFAVDPALLHRALRAFDAATKR